MEPKEYVNPSDMIAKTVEAICGDGAKGHIFPRADCFEDTVDKALASKEALKHEILKRMIDDYRLNVTRFRYNKTYVNDVMGLYCDCYKEVEAELEQLGYVFYDGYIFWSTVGFKRYICSRFESGAIKYTLDEKGNSVTVDATVFFRKDLLDDGLEPTRLVKEAFAEMFIDNCPLTPKNLLHVDGLTFEKTGIMVNDTTDAAFRVTATVKLEDLAKDGD